MQRGSELTNVINKETLLIIEDGLIPGAELDVVICPDRGVVLIEKALVWRLVAVVRTFTPIFRRQRRGSEWWGTGSVH